MLLLFLLLLLFVAAFLRSCNKCRLNVVPILMHHYAFFVQVLKLIFASWLGQIKKKGLVQIRKSLYSTARHIAHYSSTTAAVNISRQGRCPPRLFTLLGTIQSVLREHHERDITQLQVLSLHRKTNNKQPKICW